MFFTQNTKVSTANESLKSRIAKYKIEVSDLMPAAKIHQDELIEKNNLSDANFLQPQNTPHEAQPT